MERITLKRWYVVHKWTSLISTMFLLMLCITGLPLVFYHEIDHALGYSVEPPEIEHEGAPAELDAIVASAEAKRPGDAVQFVWRDPDEPDAWFVTLGETADARQASASYMFDARTGDFLHAYPLQQGIMYIVFKLHVDLFAGLPGMLFLGSMGLLLLIAIVSGVVLYAPFMRKLNFGTVRRGRSKRLWWLDLHNLLGIVTLTWLFVVGLTGVINTLALPIQGYWQQTELADMIANAPPASDGAETYSPQRAVAAARAAEPGRALSFMAFPGNPFAGPDHYTVFMRGTTPWASQLVKPLLVDGASGEVVAARDLPWYVATLLVSQPLHFGDYGGLPLKLIWAVLDVISIIVLVSGLYLWWTRRERSFEAWFEKARGGAASEPA